MNTPAGLHRRLGIHRQLLHAKTEELVLDESQSV
jgi:hypothetical protein